MSRKSILRLRRVVRTATVMGAAFMVSMTVASVSAFAASPSTLSQPVFLHTLVPTPATPQSGSSAAQWAQWAQDQHAAVASQIAATQGGNTCQVNTSQVIPLTESEAEAAGFPSGVLPEALFAVVSCPPSTSVSGSSTTSNELQVAPASTPGAGSACASVGGQVSFGTQCTYGSTSGSTAYINTSFQPSSGSQTFNGHLELSTDGFQATTCSVGTLLANGPTYSQSYGNTYILATPINASNVYNGNDWKGSSTPYTNLGNVCASV